MTLDLPLATRPRPHANWGVETLKDPLQIALEGFGAWTSDVAMNEELFTRHVYQNQNLGELDLRQHRFRLHGMIAVGEKLALDFLQIKTEAAVSHVSFIDEKLKVLNATLAEWHGSLEEDPAIPESFKQASREVAAGEFTDMEPEFFTPHGPSDPAVRLQAN